MLSMAQDQICEYHNLLEYTQKLEGQLCSLNQEKDEKDGKTHSLEKEVVHFREIKLCNGTVSIERVDMNGMQSPRNQESDYAYANEVANTPNESNAIKRKSVF